MSELGRYSFKEFYEQHFNQVFSFMKAKSPNRETAMDLTQDVFLKALQKWDHIQGVAAPSSFLFIISKNTLIDYYRHRANQLGEPIQEEGLLQVPDEPTNPEASSHTEQLVSLQQAIEALPQQRREIIKLTKIEGLSINETANHLSLSKRTVENQLYRAMKALREHFATISILALIF